MGLPSLWDQEWARDFPFLLQWTLVSLPICSAKSNALQFMVVLLELVLALLGHEGRVLIFFSTQGGQYFGGSGIAISGSSSCQKVLVDD